MSALDPSINVICCWQDEDNSELSDECLEVDLQNCDKILEEWDKTEKEWPNLNNPANTDSSTNNLLGIITAVLALIIIISIIIRKFFRKRL